VATYLTCAGASSGQAESCCGSPAMIHCPSNEGCLIGFSRADVILVGHGERLHEYPETKDLVPSQPLMSPYAAFAPWPAKHVEQND
jgi:hypothetical protein